ncbi:MAG: serine/threonine protein phosphatase [Chloroflexaceae bacterium]|nr:serine/threonine protein phosphatase [Chloroflexaceae bacterium]
MSPRRIVVGDVHGHYEALMSLLQRISLESDDQLYFLGDLIDRGPNSADVVEFIIQNNYPCLRGNHEEMLLASLDGSGQVCPEALQAWLYAGGHATLKSYNNTIPQTHFDWFNNLPYYLDLGGVWLVHAGVNPLQPLESQSAEEFCWIREPFHRAPFPYFKDKIIVTGHTLTFTFPGVTPGKLAAGPGWLDIETGAYHPQSGWLTGLDIDHWVVYQLNTKDGAFRKLPLRKAAVTIDPSRLGDRRSRHFR